MATKADAEKLWRNLVNNHKDQQTLVEEILADEENWTKLGYDPGPEGFCACWVDRSSSVPLMKGTMPFVLYAMFEAGWSDPAIEMACKNVGQKTIDGIRRRYDQGLNPDDLEVFRDKSRPEGCYFWFGPTRYDRWTDIANDLGVTLKEIAMDAIVERFEALGG